MTRGVRAAAMLAACVAAATPGLAPAQISGPSSGQSGIVQATPSEGFWAIQMMGRCFATERTDKAMALMAAPQGTSAEDAAVKALIGRPTACMRSLKSAAMDRSMLRMSIADGFVRDRAVAVDPVPYEPVAKLDAAQRKSLGIFGLIRALGDCVAARHPAEVTALAATRLNSPDEAIAFGRLMPLAEACSPGGMRFTLAQDVLRAAFSEGMVRRRYPALAGGAGMRP